MSRFHQVEELEMELAKIEEAFEAGKMMKGAILLRFGRYVGLKRRRSCKVCYSNRSHGRGMSMEFFRVAPATALCLMRSARVERLLPNCKKRCFGKAKS